jgi:23S rRNA (adenine2030-N6)-methyltransferase
MLAYRHAFHAGNHADVLKHLVYSLVLRHMNLKDKGYRVIDTHAGAGGYALKGDYAQQAGEFADGIGRLWGRDDLPPALADYVGLVRQFNPGGTLAQYPGSPAFAQMLLRGQDQLRLFELHPTEHRILDSYLGGEPGIETRLVDGFAALHKQLPPPTRRGVVLIDPPYELKVDYNKVLAAVRDSLKLFAEAVIIVWVPQLQLLDAANLPQRLRATAQAQAKKGWLQARLTVAQPVERGFGLLGSSVFVINPPHTLREALAAELPWLAQTLAQYPGAHSALEHGAGA